MTDNPGQWLWPVDTYYERIKMSTLSREDHNSRERAKCRPPIRDIVNKDLLAKQERSCSIPSGWGWRERRLFSVKGKYNEQRGKIS
jgi:hypothetical protein